MNQTNWEAWIEIRDLQNKVARLQHLGDQLTDNLARSPRFLNLCGRLRRKKAIDELVREWEQARRRNRFPLCVRIDMDRDPREVAAEIVKRWQGGQQ